MSDLQATLNEFKSEVTTLETTKTALTQEILNLNSRQRFLKEAIAKLGTAQTIAQRKYDGKIADLTEDLEAVENAITTAKKSLAELKLQIATAESDLQLIKERAEAESIKLNKELQDKKSEIATVAILKDQSLEELEGLAERVTTERNKLSTIAEQIKQAEAEADSKIIEIKQSVSVAQGKLKEVNNKIDQKAGQYDDLELVVSKKQTELEGMIKKHNDLKAYEQRVDKALKARETALMEGEAKLAMAMRRRNSVLDNIN